MVEDMRVYIANLGKYNEGYLVGDWFSFPIDEEDVAERIGLNERYEEYAVHDTENFPIEIGEYISIEELNEIFEMIEELPDYITDELDEFVSHYGSLEELYDHKDDMILYAGCEEMCIRDRYGLVLLNQTTAKVRYYMILTPLKN